MKHLSVSEKDRPEAGYHNITLKPDDLCLLYVQPVLPQEDSVSLLDVAQPLGL